MSCNWVFHQTRSWRNVPMCSACLLTLMPAALTEKRTSLRSPNSYTIYLRQLKCWFYTQLGMYLHMKISKLDLKYSTSLFRYYLVIDILSCCSPYVFSKNEFEISRNFFNQSRRAWNDFCLIFFPLIFENSELVFRKNMWWTDQIGR